MKDKHLRKQLRNVGANKTEADALAELAFSLSATKPRGLSRAAKERIVEDLPIKAENHHPVRWALAGSMAGFAVVLVFIAQSALPGSWLYDVKRGSEEVRTLVQPGYTDTLVEERKKEVEELQKQETVNPVLLHEAEKRYEKTYERSQQRQQKPQEDNRRDRFRGFNGWNWRDRDNDHNDRNGWRR